MLTLTNKEDTEIVIERGTDDVRLIVQPNIFNKFSLFLAGATRSGVQIFGEGPMALRAYYSLLDYAQLVGFALEKDYRVFIKKDGDIFSNEDWYIEFKL